MNAPTDMDWIADGNCKDLPLDQVAVVFFPQTARSRKWREFCPGCPARQECAMHGLMYEEFGVWGGLTENNRRDIRAAIARGEVDLPQFIADLS